MSICCHECGDDLRPSEDLPGREGAYVFPILDAICWNIDKQGELSWIVAPMRTPFSNTSLCLQCIQDKVPNQSAVHLKKIYAAYAQEMNNNEIAQRKGAQWIGADLAKLLAEGEGIYKNLFGQTVQNACLFCGHKLIAPYFMIKLIDRIFSGQHLVSLFGSYSWSNYKLAKTQFQICFQCFREYFPGCFAEFNYSPKASVPAPAGKKPELYMTPGFIQALKSQLGEEKAQALIDKTSEEFTVRSFAE